MAQSFDFVWLDCGPMDFGSDLKLNLLFSYVIYHP